MIEVCFRTRRTSSEVAPTDRPACIQLFSVWFWSRLSEIDNRGIGSAPTYRHWQIHCESSVHGAENAQGPHQLLQKRSENVGANENEKSRKHQKHSHFGVALTVFLVNRVFFPCHKGNVLTKTAKMTNLHSTHWKQGLRSPDPRKRRKWRKWQLSLRHRHGLDKAGFVLPWTLHDILSLYNKHFRHHTMWCLPVKFAARSVEIVEKLKIVRHFPAHPDFSSLGSHFESSGVPMFKRFVLLKSCDLWCHLKTPERQNN